MTRRHRTARNPHPGRRRAATATLALALLALTACDTDPASPEADQLTPTEQLAHDYVATFEETGKVIDAIDAAGDWQLVTDADSFNAFARWTGAPYLMHTWGEDDNAAVMSYCALDTEADVYTAVAATPTPDGASTNYAIGFGSGTDCHYDTNADLTLAVDATGVAPIEDTDGLDVDLADAVVAEFERVREQAHDAGSSGEAVVRHAASDLADDLNYHLASDLSTLTGAAPGRLPATLDAGTLVQAGSPLPRGTTLTDYVLAEEEISYCILHTGAQAWATYTAPLVEDDDTIQVDTSNATLTVGGPDDQVCGATADDTTAGQGL